MSRSKSVLIFVPILIIFSNYLFGHPQENSLQKVHRYVYVIKSKDWYQNQAKLWDTEISKNHQNEDAWYNYYFANRYASFGMEKNERKKLLDSIIDEIAKEIPDSYLYSYLKYFNGDNNIRHLEKAYQLNPDCADLYWEFLQYYDIKGMKLQVKEYCEKLYSSKDIISSLYDYNYNVLNSAEQNSILFTNGDNDNIPAWVLQEAKGVRQDVTIINTHTVFVLRDYLKLRLDNRGIDINLDNLHKEDIAIFLEQLIFSIKNKYPEIPIHIALTVYEEYLIGVKDKLFMTGLAYTYSEEQINTAAIIKKNLEQNLRLDHLANDWYNEQHVSKPMMDGLNCNYIPAFMELFKLYNSSGSIEKAEYWKRKAVLLAKKGNDQELLKKIEEGKY